MNTQKRRHAPIVVRSGVVDQLFYQRNTQHLGGELLASIIGENFDNSAVTRVIAFDCATNGAKSIIVCIVVSIDSYD